jgi:hypothetical protein
MVDQISFYFSSYGAVNMHTLDALDSCLPGHTTTTSKGRMLIMRLVVIPILPRHEFRLQVDKDSVQQPLDALVMPSISIPHLHQDTRKPDTQTDTTQVITEMHSIALIDGSLQLLAHGKKTDAFPKGTGAFFGDAEGPTAAAHVARVFPERFYVVVEEVDRVAEGEGCNVKVVEDVPEGAYVGD